MLLKAIVGTTWRPEARAFFTRLATKPSPIRQQLYNTIFAQLVANDIYRTLDCLFVLGAADSATALTNLVTGSAGGDATITGAPTFTADTGYSAAANGNFGNTNYQPGTTAGKSTQNDFSMSGWSLNSAQNAGQIVGDNAFKNFIYPREITTNLTEMAVNQASANLFSVTLGSPDGSGLWSAVRRTSTAAEYYRNGVSLGTSGATSTAPGSSIRWSGHTTDFYNGNVCCVIVGQQRTSAQERALYQALFPYMHTVAGAT